MKEGIDASYTTTIKEMYISGSMYWVNLKRKTRQILVIISLIYFSYVAYDIFLGPVRYSLFNGGNIIMNLLIISGIILFIVALATHKMPGSYPLGLFGGFIILISTRYSSWVLVFFIGYFAYKMFETRRIKRLITIANKTPDELAKIKKSSKIEPKVEITVRGRE